MNILHRVPRPVATALLLTAGLVIIWATNHIGLWWVTALVGLGIGLALRSGRTALLLSWLVALAAWGLDLLVQSFTSDIGGVAGVVALIAGLPRSAGFVVVALALLFASLLALAGAWVGVALRGVALAYGPRAALAETPVTAQANTTDDPPSAGA
jgi:hypothetical protein